MSFARADHKLQIRVSLRSAGRRVEGNKQKLAAQNSSKVGMNFLATVFSRLGLTAIGQPDWLAPSNAKGLLGDI